MVLSDLVTVSGYYCEPTVIDGLAAHWIRRFVSLLFFSYTVDELLVDLAEATECESNPADSGL